MKRIFTSTLLIVLLGTTLLAQDYKTGVGLRGGSQSGITIKQFVSERSALEGLIATRWGGVYLTGLYEWIGPYFNVEGFTWYMGLGGHVGFLGGDNSRFDDGDTHTVAGLDGILGVEYKFENAPVSIGFDWKPQYDFIGDTYFVADDAALSIRYTFGKN